PAPLQAAYRALAAGDLDSAFAAAQERLADAPEDGMALHVVGVVRLKQARAGEARALLERASRGAPGSPHVRLDLGNACLADGDLDAALRAFAFAAAQRPAWAAPHLNAASALRRAGRLLDAAREYARAARAEPAEYSAMQACVDCVAEHVRARPAPEAAPQAGGPRPLPWTIVFCSPDAARLAAARARLEPLARESGSELVAVLAPVSLAAAYNRAADQARHERILFVHDDVSFASMDPLGALERALREADVVGLAGSERATGPAVLWAGHPYLHGWVSYPAADGDGLEAAPLSLRHGIIPGIQTLDGLLIACSRDAARAVRFDADTFDGFDFYDLDFSLRAFRAGLRVAVSTEPLAVHASRGGFGDAWRRYRERFQRKFPELDAPAGAPHWYGAAMPDLPSLRAFYGELASLRVDP
ncbi:MAG TPA: glycosyltransferase, partial [Terriglobales bacterium]|nr:glycosyltransferase [Terriglobales bacterium]